MSDNKITVTAPLHISEAGDTVFSDTDKYNDRLVVTRERCVNPSLVDSFLSLLRHGTDDVIKQKMSTYDMTSTNHRFLSGKCDRFLDKELYPNWLARDQILTFCEKEMNDMKSELEEKYGNGNSVTKMPQIDSRIDPYGARDQLEERETHFSKLARLQTWLENHKQVESILRSNSDRVLKNICDENVNYVSQFWKFSRSH